MKMINREELKQALDSVKSIILTVHVHPDADAIGSMVGFYEALVHAGKDVRMVVDDVVPHKFSFMAHVDKIQTVEAIDTWQADMLLVLDASTKERIGKVPTLYEGPIYNMDHHISNSKFADALYLKPEYAATGEIVVACCNEWGWPITATMATSLYAAIASDCGFFRFSNTTEHTLAMAGLCVAQGAKPNIISEHLEATSKERLEVMKDAFASIAFYKDNRVASIALNKELMARVGDDTDGFVDIIRNVDTVDISIFLKYVDEHTTRVSLRSKQSDVNEIASHFGGGGHIRASGCTINAPIEEALTKLLGVIQ